MKNRFCRTALYMSTTFCAIIFTGCVKDTVPATDTQAGSAELIRNLTVPGVSLAGTRTLTENKESEIASIDVLVFEIHGGQEKFLYHTHATDFENTSAENGAGNGKCKVSLRKSVQRESHRLVLLANLADEVEKMRDQYQSVPGTLKDDLLSRIIFQSKDHWDTLTPRLLPMWEEAPNTLVVTPTLLGSHMGKFSMMRSVARVDLVLKPDSFGQGQGFGSGFRLDSVKVYNVSETGFAVPDPGLVAGMKVTAPTLTGSEIRSRRNYGTDAASSQLVMVREIYLPEAENTSVALAHEDVTCLVISGYYKTDAAPSWYRIDQINNTIPPPGRLSLTGHTA